MGLFLPRQSVVVPVGLITQPNQYGQYPSGSHRVARNFTLRNPGELVQAPDVQGVQSVGAANNVIHKLMPLDGGHVYSFHQNGTTWTVFDQASSASFVGSATDAFSSTGRISCARVAERMVVNGAFGNLVGDYMQPSNSTERALRDAGLPQPAFSALFTTEGGLGWLSDGQMVGYCACSVREFADGYTLRSSPSAVVKLLLDPAQSGTRPLNIGMFVRWPSGTLRAGDKIEFYRTNTLPTTDTNADPGSTFKLIATHTLTSTDITNVFAQIVDRQMTITGTNTVPGDELYTNPGQEGETYANRRPPIAKCVASFKGFAFFGNTTERAQFKFSVPGGVGSENSVASYDTGTTTAAFKASGIGLRVGGGTVTNGSPTITGVSAADLVGVKVGQRWPANSFPVRFANGTSVISIGATSITMSANASSSGSGWLLTDVIEIDGQVSEFGSIFQLSHFINGDYEFTCTRSIPTDLNGNFFMTAFTVTLERNAHPLNQTITVRATNGANYSPPLPEIGQAVKSHTAFTRKNRFQWSKEQQPEHAPSVSEGFAGFGELYAWVATRDGLWFWCSDGLYRLSGDGGALGLGNWQLDYANSSLLLASPQATCAMNEFIYGYTNVGFVEVDSEGTVVNLTDKIIGDLLPGQKYSESRSIVVEANEKNGEVLLILGDNGAGSSSTVYVFNTRTRGWTTLSGNGANLSNITALAMQRSPSSGEPRPLFGVSPLAGGTPSYSGWNSLTSFLAAEARLQPIYGDDPLDLKRWLWADYLFDKDSNGRNITQSWNGTTFGGNIPIEGFDQGGYARAGCPREVGRAHSISPGFSIASGSAAARFQGFSLPVKLPTNQSKKR